MEDNEAAPVKADRKKKRNTSGPVPDKKSLQVGATKKT